MTVHSNESANWAERLGEVIPWGSSTCSKAARLMPEEPGVIVRGKGCRVWDADGREFIDFRNALGPVTLGYAYPAVNAAIREQMESGIVFGHPHPIEGEVAELIREIIPCAEKVRFLK
ncbi:MAG: aminotransferase class III-fold pyridoxal phosphate-dependent enzyme, partial [Planctomycetota bacterium]|nr:aminotransferase class III-fold pyridoxal phosphate-dependent enzyme [Planctomycetota bacterium]